MNDRAERLDRWWSGLTDEERKDILHAHKDGRVDRETRKSMKKAGVIDEDLSDDEDVPGDVLTFLKMRH